MTEKSEDESKIEFLSPEEIKRKEEEREFREKEASKFLLSQNKGKIASLCVAAIYLIFGLIGGGEAFLQILAFLILPLALIWLPDYFSYSLMSSVNPITGFPGTNKEPIASVIAKIIGWIVLLGPAVSVVIVMFLK